MLAGKDHRSESYDIDTYFFFPASLDVTENRFSKKDIYQDLQRFFRLKASTQFLHDLHGAGENYLQDLSQLLSQKQIQPSKILAKLKITLCAYESSLRKRRRLVIKTLKKDNFTTTFTEFKLQLTTYAEKFRNLQSEIKDPIINEHFKLCDEYLSYLIRSNTLKLIKLLDSRGSHYANHRQELVKIVRQEYQYAQQHSFPLPQEKNNNRTYIYRIKGILKKNIWNVLYLNIRRKDDTTLFTQILYGIAAGMSMIFATLVAFYAQQKFGNYSTPLFVALVVGYMFKDRIKELLREFLVKLFSSKLYDHKTTLFSHDQHPLGTLKENILFLHKHHLPEQILKARNTNRQEQLFRTDQQDESVILYQKRVKLFNQKFYNTYNELVADGIKDILRFNLFPFTTIMDNPTHYALSLGKDEQIKKIACLRSYQMSILIHYKSEEDEHIERYRVVLTRDGIVNIEKRLG